MKKIDLARMYESSGNFPGLFGDQFKMLMKRGFSKVGGEEELIEFLMAGKTLAPIAQKLEERESKKGGIRQIPFLIVSRGIPLSDQLVKIAGTREYKLRFEENLLETDWGGAPPPSRWYLAVDVQLDPGLLDMTPEEAREHFKKEKRIPLNAFEGVALALHYWFTGITVTLPGSSVEKKVPYISADSSEVVMGASVQGMHFNNWLPASCGMRISVIENE